METEKQINTLKAERNKGFFLIAILAIFAVFIFILLNSIFLSADPVGPTSVVSVSNETKGGSTSAYFFNISGGYIAALNLTANIQNIRWKAFIGWVNGRYTLDDAGGSTIYDWSLTVTTGRVYATRDSSTIEWNLIGCANRTTNLATENSALLHNTTAADNLPNTFRYGTHDPFWVAGRNIAQDTCPTLNTYIGNLTQDDDFEEMALYDSTSIIYATILENDLAGYDGQTYDFQMLVPENGSQGFSGATAYYLYVELD